MGTGGSPRCGGDTPGRSPRGLLRVPLRRAAPGRQGRRWARDPVRVAVAFVTCQQRGTGQWQAFLPDLFPGLRRGRGVVIRDSGCCEPLCISEGWTDEIRQGHQRVAERVCIQQGAWGPLSTVLLARHTQVAFGNATGVLWDLRHFGARRFRPAERRALSRAVPSHPPGAPCGGHVPVASGLQADACEESCAGTWPRPLVHVVCATSAGTRTWPPTHCALLSGPWRKALRRCGGL